MGIDVYLKWDKFTHTDQNRQITGYSVTSGYLGYLRESYHGPPYATKVLFPECFENGAGDGGEDMVKQIMSLMAKFPMDRFSGPPSVKNLDKKMPLVIDPEERGKIVKMDSIFYKDDCSTITEKLSFLVIDNKILQKRLPDAISASIKRHTALYGESLEEAKHSAKSYKDFVELHKRKEEKGLNPIIHVSA